MGAKQGTLLALGDCNTLGIGDCRGQAYPEQWAQQRGLTVRNAGYTMATTREGYYLCRDSIDDTVQIITLQFGLVDAWQTVRYSPYVLYYPDNPWRFLGRKLAKKYKKLARQWHFQRWLGLESVVPLPEYLRQIEHILILAANRPVFLLDTVPNQDISRNPFIQQYNAALTQLAERFSHVCKIDLYAAFAQRLDQWYLDATHINLAGHQYIVTQLEQGYQQRCP